MRCCLKGEGVRRRAAHAEICGVSGRGTACAAWTCSAPPTACRSCLPGPPRWGCTCGRRTRCSASPWAPPCIWCWCRRCLCNRKKRRGAFYMRPQSRAAGRRARADMESAPTAAATKKKSRCILAPGKYHLIVSPAGRTPAACRGTCRRGG